MLSAATDPAAAVHCDDGDTEKRLAERRRAAAEAKRFMDVLWNFGEAMDG
jgi:hypothetical protein